MKTPSLLSEKVTGYILRKARQNLEKDGWLAPILFVGLANGKSMMAPLELPNSSKRRQMYFQQIGTQIRASGKQILEAAFVSETWFINPQKVPGATRFPPGKHPARQEAVMVIGRNAANTLSTQVIQPYIRGEGSRFVWEEYLAAEYEQPVESGNRTVGLLDYLFDE